MKRLGILNVTKKIQEIQIHHIVDDQPDLSFLGVFDNTPGQFPIHHSDDPGQFRYFNAENVSNKREAEENYKRYLEFVDGIVCMKGIRAEARILTGSNILFQPQDATINRISSRGLWGIESDVDEEYVKEIEQSELDELRDILFSLGFAKKQIDGAPFERIHR